MYSSGNVCLHLHVIDQCSDPPSILQCVAEWRHDDFWPVVTALTVIWNERGGCISWHSANVGLNPALSVTQHLLWSGRGQVPYSKNIPRLWWWWGYCIIKTLSHCLCHLSKCLNNAPTVQYVSVLFENSHFVFDLLLLTTDLDQQLNEAEARTESLRAESLFVSQKPLTDSACLKWVSSTVGMLREVYIFGHTDTVYGTWFTCNYIMSQNTILMRHKRINNKCCREKYANKTQRSKREQNKM